MFNFADLTENLIYNYLMPILLKLYKVDNENKIILFDFSLYKTFNVSKVIKIELCWSRYIINRYKD